MLPNWDCLFRALVTTTVALGSAAASIGYIWGMIYIADRKNWGVVPAMLATLLPLLLMLIYIIALECSSLGQ